MVFQLRPATHADFDYIYQVKKAALGPYVAATWGWDELYQRTHFAQEFDPSIHQVIVVGPDDIDYLSVFYRESEIYLAGLYIQPEYQRLGFGSLIITNIVEDGRRSGRPVSLQVLKVNPAIRLYERLGFCIIEERQYHYVMRIEP